MKIHTQYVLKDLHGDPIKDKGKDTTLETVLTTSLLSQGVQENPDGNEKYKRFKLANRIIAGGVVELSAEDVVLLKKVVGQTYMALAVGRVFDILEGVEKTEDWVPPPAE